MRPLILFLMGLCVPVALMAQDDMYFIPSQHEEQEAAGEDTYAEAQYEEEYTQGTYSNTRTYDIRDVDAYNRRGEYADYADAMTDSTGYETGADAEEDETTEMSCTERIILFHSPTVGVWVSSPYYWDYYYYDYWWYDPWFYPYYAWNSWWWHRPWYAGWWGGIHWGIARPPHHFVDVGSHVGQWRPGPRGGYVRYGTSNRNFATTRTTGTGNTKAASNRSFTSSRRTFNNSRSTANSSQTTRSYNNTTRRFSTSSRQTTTQSSQRSYTPSRSSGTTRSVISSPSRSGGSVGRSAGGGGGGRSFGGRR